jgi:hypothetical protein
MSMRPRLGSLRAPILFASLLIVAGVGYAAYSSTATVNVNANTASFEIVYTALTDPGAPPNVNTFAASTLPSATPTLNIGTLLGGQTIYVDYTVEDIGTLPAYDVVEQAIETSTNCDGTLALAQVGLGPTTLTPLVPVTAVFSITDNAGPGPVPGGCPDPFTAVWHFEVTGTAGPPV